MPPRKSNVSVISTATNEETTPSKDKERKRDKDIDEGLSIEDLSLPRTMIQRLAKGILPPNTQIQKDAITAMSKGATVFVNYLAQAANDITLTTTSKRTIQPAHVLLALQELEFSAFVPRLEAELAKYSEVAAGKRNEYRRKVKEGTMGGGLGRGRRKKSVPGEEGEGMDVGDGGEEGEEGMRKRVRLDGEEGDMEGVEEMEEMEGAMEDADEKREREASSPETERHRAESWGLEMPDEGVETQEDSGDDVEEGDSGGEQAEGSEGTEEEEEGGSEESEEESEESD